MSIAADQLTAHEIDALKMLAGHKPIEGGAWFNVCCEYLQGCGYVSRTSTHPCSGGMPEQSPAPPPKEGERMNNEMTQGYLDGLNPDSPEPNDNRSHSYRHGFANGRDDLNRKPRASAAVLRDMADEAEKKDSFTRWAEGLED